MARISIKKNFVDGDKLFAQQLNNNFETIEKAVNDGNKIVWQDGTEVTFKRYVTSDIDSLPISDGAIIYDTEKGRHYIDYLGRRIQVGSAGKEVVIQEEQPTEEDNKLWIDSDIVNTIGTEIVNEHTESETLGYSANYLNKLITPEYCDLILSSQFNVEFNGTQWQTIFIPFDKLYQKQGNFTLENNGIKIGKGISKIRLTFGINTIVGAEYDTGFQVVKNNESIIGKTIKFSTHALFTDSFIIDVQEGDILKLKVQNNWAKELTIQLRGASYPATHLLVEKIS